LGGCGGNLGFFFFWGQKGKNIGNAADLYNPEIVVLCIQTLFTQWKLDAERIRHDYVGNQTFVNEKPESAQTIPHNIAIALMNVKMS